MLHFAALQAAAREGLDPLIGVYHDLKPGRDSLVCDLVEPVRAAVDRFAHDIFAEGILRVESFSVSETGCKLGKAGRTAFYRAFEEMAAATIRERVAAEARSLACAIATRFSGRRTHLPLPLDRPRLLSSGARTG